jgi:glutamyl-tRNA synthetase
LPFESANLEEKVKQFVQEKGAKPGDVLPLLRIALAGTMKGPAVFDMAVALGSAETMTRLKRFVEIFNK